MPQFVPLFFLCFVLFFLLEAAVYLSLMCRVVNTQSAEEAGFGWKRRGAVMSSGVQQQCNFVSYALCAMLQFLVYKGFSRLNSLNCSLGQNKYCILQSVELFLKTNVCYKCKCIFFQILYTIVHEFVLLFTSSCTKMIYLGRELNVEVYCAVPHISLYSTAYLKPLEHCLQTSLFSVCDFPFESETLHQCR